MGRRALRVVCPGCGQAKTIELPVGQRLRCDLCQTTFFALIKDPGHPTELIHAAPASCPVHADFACDTTQSHAWGAEDVMEDVQKPAVGVDSPTTPIRSAPFAEPLDASHRKQPLLSLDNGDDREGELTTTVGSWGLVLVLASVALLGTCGAVYLLVRAGSDSPVGAASPAESLLESSAGQRWTDASRSSLQLGQIVVKVERVVLGAIRAKDMNHEVMIVDDENLLAITLSVRNRAAAPRPFHNWYQHAFETPDGQQVPVELADDTGRIYEAVNFDDVSRVDGQRWAAEIDPHETVQDVLVFAASPDLDRSAIRFFRLAVPAAAVEFSGYFRFQIPVTMIEGF